MMESILVIQSDPIVRDLMSLALSRAGYRVEAAVDLGTGLQALRRTAPDLILLDLFLKDGIGLENITRVRKGAEGIPIVIVSRQGFRETVQGAVLAGAADFLVKPVDGETLIARVQRVLERRQGLSDSSQNS